MSVQTSPRPTQWTHSLPSTGKLPPDAKHDQVKNEIEIVILPGVPVDMRAPGEADPKELDDSERNSRQKLAHEDFLLSQGAELIDGKEAPRETPQTHDTAQKSSQSPVGAQDCRTTAITIQTPRLDQNHLARLFSPEEFTGSGSNSKPEPPFDYCERTLKQQKQALEQLVSNTGYNPNTTRGDFAYHDLLTNAFKLEKRIADSSKPQSEKALAKASLRKLVDSLTVYSQYAKLTRLGWSNFLHASRDDSGTKKSEKGDLSSLAVNRAYLFEEYCSKATKAMTQVQTHLNTLNDLSGVQSLKDGDTLPALDTRTSNHVGDLVRDMNTFRSPSIWARKLVVAGTVLGLAVVAVSAWALVTDPAHTRG